MITETYGLRKKHIYFHTKKIAIRGFVRELVCLLLNVKVSSFSSSIYCDEDKALTVYPLVQKKLTDRLYDFNKEELPSLNLSQIDQKKFTEYTFVDPPAFGYWWSCLLYTSPSPRDLSTSRMPSSA